MDVYGGVAPAWAGDGCTRPLSRRKGLTNDAGENNCFLNVIIQSLWHVRSCRVLISMGDHAAHHRCGGAGSGAESEAEAGAKIGRRVCLLCELEQIFVLYQFSEQPVLEVDRVRLALGDVFALGAMNDATETLEAILDALHFDTFSRMLLMKRGVALEHQVGAGVRDADLTQSVRADAAAIVCEPQCVAHLLFQMNLMELRTCAACGETAEPLMNTDFLYRVYAQELLQHVKAVAGATKKTPTLEEVLCREAQGLGNSDGAGAGSCDACQRGGAMKTSRWMLTLPMVFAVSIIWSSDQVNKAQVKSWMDLLSTQHTRGDVSQTQRLDLGRIFRMDMSPGAHAEYAFRGMVCYYGRHYVGFFASRSLEDGKAHERWFLFDDTRVKRVGTWADVRLRVERGGYQPTLLFYERTGIELDKLEQTAAEIHKWWEQTAEEKAAAGEDDAAPLGGEAVMVSAVEPDESASLASGTAAPPIAELVSSLRQSARLTPTAVLPTSPIRVPKGPPMSVPAAGVPAWHDEDIRLMHLSAQDTLSKLNDILGKDRAPVTEPPDGREMLRMAMSMSMRQSVRRRDYSVHRLTDQQLHVNRDAIFMDVSEDSASKPPAARSASAAAAAKPSSPQKPPLRQASSQQRGLREFDVELHASDGGIGLLLEESEENLAPASSSARDGSKRKRAFAVAGFEVNGAGEKLPAEASGAIDKGDVLVAINGRAVDADALYDVLEQLLTAASPVRLTFRRDEPWACPRCTLLNATTETQCAACGHSA